MQGDITDIIDSSGNIVASYTYDAWGNILTKTGAMADVNPFRYRGYYYDTETGFYSIPTESGMRYYDSQIGSYISAKVVSELSPTSIDGLNLFTYGCNNSVVVNANTEPIAQAYGVAIAGSYRIKWKRIIKY